MRFSIPDWELVEKALACHSIHTMYLWGPPGSGKTYAAYHYGRVAAGFYAITLTDETSAVTLKGHYLMKAGDGVWHDGPFTRAMREGKRLVINEISNASADVLALLFPVLEADETARLTLENGETIIPAKGFHVIATDNRSPENLPEALQDRFKCYIEVRETHPAALARLSPGLRKIAEQMIGDPDRRISARGWLALEDLIPEFGMSDACKMVFGEERGVMLHESLKLSLNPETIESDTTGTADSAETA